MGSQYVQILDSVGILRKSIGILRKRNNISGQVKEYIDNNLDPNSKSFSNDLSVQETLSSMRITEYDYYCTLSILPDNDYEIQLKRSTCSCFVNNCNPVLHGKHEKQT